ncbi:MAG: type IV secretory system conjugative DNA transfer family protein [Ruminococcus sp.]|nr:type IV secretory system conjugative DNA transfer family protein [Ruminococcus sp.]
MNTRKIKKYALKYIPYLIFFYIGDLLGCAYRTAEGDGFSEKMVPFMNNMGTVFAKPILSLVPFDLLIGAATAGAMFLVIYMKSKNKKNYKQGVEYGSAKWAGEKDIEPYMDFKNFDNNILLTQTERLTMGKPSSPKYARNKNVLIIGGSGSGKTRFFIKPNLMQMHSSYVVTDPKGTVLVECGKLLQRGRPRKDGNGKVMKDKDGKTIYEPYKIKVFNTVDFDKSMHYNPFAYISEKSREKDILKFVETLIKNTNGSKQGGGDDFWEKAEKLLYQAYIAMIFCVMDKEEWCIPTLVEMINESECREDDEEFKNAIDVLFENVELWLNGELTAEQFDDADTGETNEEEMEDYANFFEIEPTPEQRSIGSFAIKQYKAYKLAAGKTAKSILISCSTRLAPFSIDEVSEIVRYDELELDKLGDELSALFVIISDSDATFNFLVAIMYSQMFNLLLTKADNSPGGKLTYHVRCLLDEFANIGEIPQFDKLIATIRSREVSACIVLQAKAQLKAIYKDNADTIEGNCDTTLFLGGKEKTTLKEISESLGKETIDSYNTSENRGQSQSYGLNYQKLGKELMSQDELAIMDGGKCILQIRGVRPFFSDKFDITKHKNYKYLLDDNPNLEFNIGKYVAKCRKVYQERYAEVGKDEKVEQYAATLSEGFNDTDEEEFTN